ncbi:hypothetical protein AVEN_47190-1 [Araneus ventricosus]|uniref:Uncharacterized protein n=1 Tax=Araneus ventricosus TaxID=182803 RepID=A0A4Y2EDI9_ARAVE|nr:hypothetical protein AVEN_47190-1 [Araneus ventricosus]
MHSIMSFARSSCKNRAARAYRQYKKSIRTGAEGWISLAQFGLSGHTNAPSNANPFTTSQSNPTPAFSDFLGESRTTSLTYTQKYLLPSVVIYVPEVQIELWKPCAPHCSSSDRFFIPMTGFGEVEFARCGAVVNVRPTRIADEPKADRGNLVAEFRLRDGELQVQAPIPLQRIQLIVVCFRGHDEELVHVKNIRSQVQFSSVILTSRSEVTRGLFCGGHRNFEPRSDDEDDTWAGTHSPNFRTTPTGGRLVPYLRFNVQKAKYTTDLQWNRVSNLETSGPQVETLPLGHRAASHVTSQSHDRRNSA